MSRLGCMLLIVAAGAQMTLIVHGSGRHAYADDATATPVAIPTVSIKGETPVSIPTVTIPQPTPTATLVPTKTPKPVAKKAKPKKPVKKPSKKQPQTQPRYSWIWAYLTSYCPGSAGWLSSSGVPVYYGMLANDYYPFGTRVYLPVLGITGVVQDRQSDYTWNHFDVWSPTCYGTPTGYYKVGVVG